MFAQGPARHRPGILRPACLPHPRRRLPRVRGVLRLYGAREGLLFTTHT